MLNRIMPALMIVSGLLTMTMLYVAIAPVAAAEKMFGETPSGAMATVALPNLGLLIGLMGALLVWGGVHAPSRKLALIVAGASKIGFISLVLMQGEKYLSGLGVPVVVDAVMVVLFALYLVFGRSAKG